MDIIITADYGEEFNESHQNYWGTRVITLLGNSYPDDNLLASKTPKILAIEQAITRHYANTHAKRAWLP